MPLNRYATTACKRYRRAVAHNAEVVRESREFPEYGEHYATSTPIPQTIAGLRPTHTMRHVSKCYLTVLDVLLNPAGCPGSKGRMKVRS